MLKNKMIVFTFLFFLIMNNVSTSQTGKIGLRFEPGISFTELKGKSEIVPIIFSISGNILFEPTEWFNLEVRPGILYMDDDYSGFEIGLFARFKLLPSRIYLITGINNHSNKSFAENSGSGSGKNILYKSIGIGYRIFSTTYIDLTYYWTADKDYASVRETDGLTYLRIINKQMNGILKIGINLSWDIF